MREYLPIGRIINTHGVKGEVKLDPWCDGPDALKKVKTVYLSDDGTQPLPITGRRVHGKFLLISLEGVDTLDLALKFKGKELYAHRKDITKKDGSYFIDDLLGLDVIDNKNGEVLGKVSDVINRGAGDILEVKMPDGGEFLLPMVKEFIVQVDPEKAIYVTPPNGLIEKDR